MSMQIPRPMHAWGDTWAPNLEDTIIAALSYICLITAICTDYQNPLCDDYEQVYSPSVFLQAQFPIHVLRTHVSD